MTINDGISKQGEEREMIQNKDADSWTTDDNKKTNECLTCNEQIQDKRQNAKRRKPKMIAAMRRKKDRYNK